MTDIAQLGFDIRSDSAVRATDNLDDMTAAARRAEGGQARLAKASHRSDVALARTARVTRAAGSSAMMSANNMRMMSMQLGQVAQQGAVTGNFMQALAIQAGDLAPLLGVSGLAGLAFTLAASLSPVALGFLEGGEKAREFGEALEELEARTKSAKDELALLRSGLDSIEQLYAQRGIARLEAERLELQTRIEAATGRTRRSLELALQSLEAEIAAAREKADVERETTQELERQKQAREDLLARTKEIADNERRVAEGMRQAAHETDEAQQMAKLLREGISVSTVAAMDLAGVDIASGISAAERQAALLADQLGVAFVRAQQIQNMSVVEAMGLNMPGGLGGPQGPAGLLPQNPNAEFPGNRGTIVNPGTTASAAGAASGVRELSAAAREAENVIRQAREAAVQYADVVSVLDQRLASGEITQATYSEAVQRTKEAFSEASEAGEYWQRTQADFEQGFARAIARGESLSDVFRNLALNIAEASLQAALFGSGPLGGNTNGIFGGITNAIFGGFRAQGGPVQPGRSYVVGERGPELFVPQASGQIVPAASGTPASGGGTTVIVNNYSGEQTREERTRGPDGRRNG